MCKLFDKKNMGVRGILFVSSDIFDCRRILCFVGYFVCRRILCFVGYFVSTFFRNM